MLGLLTPKIKTATTIKVKKVFNTRARARFLM